MESAFRRECQCGSVRAMLALFQIVVAVAVFAVIHSSVVGDLGLAPAAVSLFVAFLVTGLVARLIDSIRFRISRRRGHRGEPERQSAGLPRIDRHLSDSPQLTHRRRISQDRSDTI